MLSPILHNSGKRSISCLISPALLLFLLVNRPHLARERRRFLKKIFEAPLVVQPLKAIKIYDPSDPPSPRRDIGTAKGKTLGGRENASKRGPKAPKSKRDDSKAIVAKSLASKRKYHLQDESFDEETRDSTALVARPPKKVRDDSAGGIGVSSPGVPESTPRETVDICEISSSPSLEAPARSPVGISDAPGTSSRRAPEYLPALDLSLQGMPFEGPSGNSASHRSPSEIWRYYQGKVPLRFWDYERLSTEVAPPALPILEDATPYLPMNLVVDKEFSVKYGNLDEASRTLLRSQEPLFDFDAPACLVHATAFPFKGCTKEILGHLEEMSARASLHSSASYLGQQALHVANAEHRIFELDRRESRLQKEAT